MRWLRRVLAVALGCILACRAFEPDVSAPSDGGATETDASPDAGDPATPDGGGPGDGSDDARDGRGEAGADASFPGVSCAAIGAVDFCSDFENGALPGAWTGILPTAPGPFVVITTPGGHALSVAVPTDSVPTTGVLYQDVPAAKTMAFGVDIKTTKAWTTGDYVEPFSIGDSGDTFTLKLRFEADGSFVVDVKGQKIANLGAQPLASATRITGIIDFGSTATQFVIRRDGVNIPSTPVAAVTQPTSLRVMAGLVYAEAQGGGAIQLDTVVVDRLP